MAADDTRTIRVTIRGPVALSDLPGLGTRICRLLEGSAAGIVLCDVHAAGCDAVVVDALARLELAARSHGSHIRLLRVPSGLRDLIAFMGLQELLLA